MRAGGAVFMILLSSCAAGAADGLPARAADLPKYDLAIRFDSDQHLVHIRQTVTWTNRTIQPATDLVFNFYPHYRIPDGDHLHLAKTLELLRLNPNDGIDRAGRHGEVQSVVLTGLGGESFATPEPLKFSYRHDNNTAFVVELPRPVAPGESVSVTMNLTVALPNKQGRWGHWRGVSFLTNALPVLAFRDHAGWHAMPFVPWHQPFWNEAGVYTATIDLPTDQKLACPAEIVSESVVEPGWKRCVTAPFTGRDFSLVASAEFREFTSSVKVPDGRTIRLTCLAFERHEHYANEILKIVAEAIPVYCQWFGPYPYDRFTVAESFFGWNGNECAGMVLIDERVFGMPHLARGYVEYLVSHETSHQWWYNLVGTNGYAETFMDEGAATYFTHRLLDRKHGRNNSLLNWPVNVPGMPNIQRDNYRYAGMVGTIRRGEMPAAAGELPGFNHLVGLFSGAYDRGSKVFGMIESRLGEAAFEQFTRDLVAKYSWRVLSVADFRTELEELTGKPWNEFFEKWVYGKSMTDWAVESVNVNADAPRPLVRIPSLLSSANPYARRRVSVIVRQQGELDEPVILGVRGAKTGEFVRIPIASATQPVQLADHKVTIEPLGSGRVKVEFDSDGAPEQIVLDPDHILLDANPGNNSWKAEPRYSVSPVYSMLNETDLTNDYDRWNFGAGPWIGGALYPDPWYTRSTMLGARAGMYRTQFFSGGAYAAVRSDYRDMVVGVDGLIDHEPLRKTQIGFNWEQRIGGPWFSQNGENTATRASVFARSVLQYGSSLYLPPIHYVEGYSTYQDNFLPDSRKAEHPGDRWDRMWMSGLHYRLNLYTPYWDPECGFWADAVYGMGTAAMPRQPADEVWAGMHQFRSELAAVKALPSCLPVVGSSRIAIRGMVMAAVPDRGKFYALGGGTTFRGFDMAERQGSAMWVANAEWRLPLFRDVTWDALDHVIGVRNLWFAAFYDVGAVYVKWNRVGNVVHALGGGLRVDSAIFSFIERATLRFDVAKTLNANSPVQFWFGVQHPF